MQDNPSYSYIGTVRTPDGGTHYLKDAEARAAITEVERRADLAEGDISSLKDAVRNGTHFLGKCLTALTDRCTTNPVRIQRDAQEKTVTAVAGDFAVCTKALGNGTVGVEFLFDGSCWTELGSTGTLKALAYKDSASGTVKPTGSVSKPTATVTPQTASITRLTASVDASTETLTLGTASSTVLTGVSVDVSKPTFTGDTKTVTVA